MLNKTVLAYRRYITVYFILEKFFHIFNMDVKEEEITHEATKLFCSQTDWYKKRPLVMIQPYKQVYLKGYMEFHERLQSFECFDDDVWITSHPKCGTTWMQEMVWSLRYNRKLEPLTVELDDRMPYLDRDTWFPEVMGSIDRANEMARPRSIKSHLSYDMLPKALRDGKGKIINVIRNPRDACVSYLNHERILRNYTGTTETFVEMFTNDVGPQYSSFFVHVLSYWKQRHQHANMLVIKYEDMQIDLAGVIRKVAKFIGEDVSEDEIPKLCEHLSFRSMKNNSTVNFKDGLAALKERMNNKQEGEFMNKGIVGNWKEKLSEEMIQKLKDYEEKWLKDSDLKFVYEI